MKKITNFSGKYAFLSNFHYHPLKDSLSEQNESITVEHVYQAFKAATDEEAIKILNAKTPGEAKKLGRKVKIADDWDKAKKHIMFLLLEGKFTNEDLKNKLLKTGSATLVEGNYWHDNYWGNCTCDKCKEIPGANILGKLLMTLRSSYLFEQTNKEIKA